MPIRKLQGRLCIVRLEITAAEIPSRLTGHARRYPGAGDLETAGRSLAAGGFAPAACADFVRRVCKWGGGYRQLDRVRDNNAPAEVSAALREGVVLARSDQVAEAVERIRLLRNLGQSFASKQLRFLEPTRAVILDSVIRTQLGYAETAIGYEEFLTDCQTILSDVTATSDMQGAGLRVCDIEAAIYAKLKGIE